MSDKPEGPGWWQASDGQWYAPELRPSAHGSSPTETPAAASEPRRWQGQSTEKEHVGPQFPDLFQKAMQGSHLADNVSVKYDGDDERNVAPPTPTRMHTRVTTPATGGNSEGVVGATIGAPTPTKRRWRKGR